VSKSVIDTYINNVYLLQTGVIKLGKNSKYINSIKRAVKILDLYTENTENLGITEISKILDINKSTVYKIVNTLRDEGLLIKNETNQKYMMGYKILDLASKTIGQYDYKEISLKEMKELRDDINETVILSVYTKQGGFCLEKVDPKNKIKLTSQAGHIIPLYAGATGKVLLANAPKEDMEKIITDKLKKFTNNTEITEKKLRKQLNKIKEQGYALSKGELDEGAIAIGAPILDKDGKLIYGLSIAGPAGRMEKKGINEIIEKVITKAKNISTKIKLIKSIKCDN